MKVYERRCVIDGKATGVSRTYRWMVKLFGKEFAQKMTYNQYIGEIENRRPR